MAAAAFLSARAAALLPGGRALSRRLTTVSCAAAAAASGVEFTGKVGFLGLGIMGAPMASNLIKAGCVCNLSSIIYYSLGNPSAG
jgi:glyoxylate/succinic semialdehyde reductase